MVSLLMQALSDQEKSKVASDLQIIDKLSKKGKLSGLRIVISGGYAVDGFLGVITRAHDDIDIQIYGRQEDGKEVVEKLFEQNIIAPDKPRVAEEKQKLVDLNNQTIIDKGRKEFYHEFHSVGALAANIYYLQVTTELFINEKIIVKKDRSFGEKHAYNTKYGKIDGITFEIQNPLTEVVDKIYKRDYRGDPKYTKHEQDIENLCKFISEKDIQTKLKGLLRK